MVRSLRISLSSVVAALAMMVLAGASVPIGAFISNAFPILEWFRVDYVQKAEGGILVGGEFSKRRSCELLAINVYSQRGDFIIERLKWRPDKREKEEVPSTRPLGVGSWGPWWIEDPTTTPSHIVLHGVYRCLPWLPSQDVVWARIKYPFDQ